MNGWTVSKAETRQEMPTDVGTATTRGTLRGLSPSIHTGPVRYIARQKVKGMNRIKGLALGLGVATLIVVGLACGGGNDVPPADFDAPPAAKLIGTSVAPPPLRRFEHRMEKLHGL